MADLTSHGEKIRCPKCGEVFVGLVAHTKPWPTYAAGCPHCGYTVTGSDWKRV